MCTQWIFNYFSVHQSGRSIIRLVTVDLFWFNITLNFSMKTADGEQNKVESMQLMDTWSRDNFSGSNPFVAYLRVFQMEYVAESTMVIQ